MYTKLQKEYFKLKYIIELLYIIIYIYMYIYVYTVYA